MTAPTLQIKRLEERIKELEAALRPLVSSLKTVMMATHISWSYELGYHVEWGDVIKAEQVLLASKLAAERPEVE